jgi:CSLREA domain-containing protein
VDTLSDELSGDGKCSLREAVRAANLDAAVDACPPGNGADVILLSAGVYSLTLAGAGEDAALTGDLDVTESLTIIGAGLGATGIDGSSLDRIFDVRSGAGLLRLSALSVANGDSGASPGGAIRAIGSTLVLDSVAVAHSTTTDVGGGVFVSLGSLSAVHSRIHHNSAWSGGGLQLAYSPAVMEDSLVDSNAAIDPAQDGSGDGGGLVSALGSLTLVNSTFSGNTADEDGGGLYLASDLSLFNVTIAGNTADADSDASGDGGGLYLNSNSVPGVVFTTHNSLIGANLDDSGAGVLHPDCSGSLISAGYNFVEDATGCTLVGDLTGNVIGLSPNLGALQDNGGPTLSQALLAGSPAIDAADPSGCAGPGGAPLTADQRAYARPVDGNSDSVVRCDIGAYEANSAALPPTATSSPWPTEIGRDSCRDRVLVCG